MALRISKLKQALPDIERVLDGTGKRVLSFTELRVLLEMHRAKWQLPVSTGLGQFLEALTLNSRLTEVRIELPHRPALRYTWNSPSTLEIVQSLSRKGYFSHYSAIFLHGLTTQIPRSIYFNIEQPGRGGGGELTQASIDRAFRGAGRVSHNVTTLLDQELNVLNGQNTGELGVIDFSSTEGQSLRVTNIERTLIDATVRPYYSAGVHEVAAAFVAAAEQLSLNRIVAYLRTLNFTYPYHQAIGYYLQRTGRFSSKQLEPFQEIGLSFDFYLTYGMKETQYVPEWRLFVPQGFDSPVGERPATLWTGSYADHG